MLKQRQGKRYVGYCVLFNLLPLEVLATRILVRPFLRSQDLYPYFSRIRIETVCDPFIHLLNNCSSIPVENSISVWYFTRLKAKRKRCAINNYRLNLL